VKYDVGKVEGHNWSNCFKPKKYNISTKNNKTNLVYYIARYNLDTNSDTTSKANIYQDTDKELEYSNGFSIQIFLLRYIRLLLYSEI
jgi:hypothetical protein